jgi:acyl-CoA synthetase (AMP-forming)/AMP-acid ligase II
VATAAIAGTAAAAAYLDAKFHIRHDLHNGTTSNVTAIAQQYIVEREKQGKLLLYHLFESHAQTQPDHLFLEFEGRSWSYGQFFRDMQRVGNWLIRDLKIQPGEMVALNGPNSPEYMLLWFALEGIGAGVSYVNCNLTGQPLIHSAKVGFWYHEQERLLISDSCAELAI